MYIEMNPTGLTLSDLICVAHRKRSEDTGFPYAVQSCRCSNCRYVSEGKCSLKECCCMAERVRAHTCTFAEILHNCFANVKDNVFHYRLRLAAERVTMAKTCFLDREHRARFQKALHRVRGNDKSLIAQLFVLTATESLWSASDDAVGKSSISYQTQLATLTYSREVWCSFLRTAAFQYKYSFPDQVLIWSQRPHARACAELELWNKVFDRWVNRHAKGIALIKDKGIYTGIRYVFDVADTHGRHGEELKLWQVRNGYHDDVTEALENRFGKLEDDSSFVASVISACQNAVEDNMTDYLSDLSHLTGNSALEGMDEDNLKKGESRKMNTSGEAAEQVMRMSLEGAEILIKLTGSGAKNAAVLLYSIYKEQNKTRGKERLTNMLRSGKPCRKVRPWTRAKPLRAVLLRAEAERSRTGRNR